MPPIDRIAELERLKQITPDRRWIFAAQAFATRVQDPRPISAEFTWQEYWFDDDTFKFINLGHRKSAVAGNDYANPGTFVTAPNLLVMKVSGDTGPARYVYMPATQMVLCRVLSHTGGTNTTYTVRSVDSAIQKVASNVIDRWPAITYQPRAANSMCILMIPTGNSIDLGLVAFEKPTVVSCPSGASPGAPPTFGSGGNVPVSSPRTRGWFGI